MFSCFDYFYLSSKVLRPQTFLNLAFANRKLTLVVQTMLLFLSTFVNSFSFSPHVVDVMERHSALIFKMLSGENSHLQVVHFYNSRPKCITILQAEQMSRSNTLPIVGIHYPSLDNEIDMQGCTCFLRQINIFTEHCRTYDFPLFSCCYLVCTYLLPCASIVYCDIGY